MTDNSNCASGASSPVKVSCSFTKVMGAALSEHFDQSAQIVEIAGQPIHTVYHHGISVSDEIQERC